MPFLNLGTAIYFKWTPTTIGSLLTTYQPRWHAVSDHGELLRSQASLRSGKILVLPGMGAWKGILVLQVEEFVKGFSFDYTKKILYMEASILNAGKVKYPLPVKITKEASKTIFELQ